MPAIAAGRRRRAAAIVGAIAWAVLCAVAAYAAAPPPADPPSVQPLKAQYVAWANDYRDLAVKQKDLLARQSQLAAEIEKVQESNPGVLARLRLERLLAANLELSNQLSDIAAGLSANDKARAGLRDDIYRAYTNEMENVLREMRQAPDRRAAGALAHRFYELRELRAPWQTATVAETDFGRQVVEVSDRDGPDELNAKADLLADLAAKVRTAIRDLEKEVQRLRREAKLANDMNAMVKEMNLFEEGVRFGRRPDEGTRPPESPLPSASSTAPDAGRPPPILPEQQAVAGAERAAHSWSAEIKRLEHEIAALNQLLRELTARADELRKKARELRQRNAAGYAPARSGAPAAQGGRE